MADHLGAHAYSVGSWNAGVGIDRVAGVVGRQGDHGHVVFHQHGRLDTPMSESVERVVVRVEAGGDEALLEEPVELVLLEGDLEFPDLDGTRKTGVLARQFSGP